VDVLSEYFNLYGFAWLEDIQKGIFKLLDL